MATKIKTSRKTSPRRTSRPKAMNDYSTTYSHQPRSKSSTLLIILVVILAFFSGYLYFKVQSLNQKNAGTAGAPQQQQAAAPGAKVKVDVGHLPVLGNKDAKITVIEFADFQCPFCKRLFSDVEPGLKKDYIDTGKVKFYYRHYAFLGQESTWSAEAAECANEQGKFWEYHDYLFNNQGSENSGAFSKANLEKFAQTLGLDSTQFNSCLESDKYAKNVQDDLSAGQKAGVNGTPATFVNGLLISGAQPYSAFKSQIDQELSK